MKRTITITAITAGTAVALAIGAQSWFTGHCGSWSPFGCDGADPELTKLIR